MPAPSDRYRLLMWARRMLRIGPTASHAEIRAAYRALAKHWHPDRFGSDPTRQREAEETLKRINRAYEILSEAAHGVAAGPAPPPPTARRRSAATSRGWTIPSQPDAEDRWGLVILLAIALASALSYAVHERNRAQVTNPVYMAMLSTPPAEPVPLVGTDSTSRAVPPEDSTRTPTPEPEPRQAVLAEGPARVLAYASAQEMKRLSERGRCSALLEVRNTEGCYRLEAEARGRTWDEASGALASKVAWRDGFLFIRSGPGSQVFFCGDGVLTPLGWLPGDAYRDGTFYGTFSGLAVNGLTSRDAAPSFEVVLRFDGSGLAPDLDATWLHNRDRLEVQRRLARGAASGEPDSVDVELVHRQDVLAPHLFVAALAKYCGRNEELEATMSTVLEAAPLEITLQFRQELDRVQPGAFPTGRKTNRPRPCGPSARG